MEFCRTDFYKKLNTTRLQFLPTISLARKQKNVRSNFANEIRRHFERAVA